MKKRFLVLFLVVLLARPAVTGARAADLYHPPQTPAEQALDHVLRFDESNGGVLSALNTGRPAYSAGNAAQYAALFTPQLINSITAVDRQKAQANCGGDFSKGACGLNYDPLMCAQNYPDTFVYRTINSTSQQALVAYSWPDSNEDTGVYKLVYENDAWKIDGISCTDEPSGKFNMQ